jgi:hypothetical protein
VDVDGDVVARRLMLWGDRGEIRERSAQWTLDLLRRRLAEGVAPTEPAAAGATRG